jgi:hypothetical protein
LIGLIALAIGGCTPLIEVPAAVPTDSVRERETAAPSSAPQEEIMPQPDLTASPSVQQAMADLASRLGIDSTEITVVRVVEVDWPDGSLGCPQPGMAYRQVLTNGSFIQLQVNDQTYNYHSGGSRAPFLCTSKDEALPEDLPGSLGGDPDV